MFSPQKKRRIVFSSSKNFIGSCDSQESGVGLRRLDFLGRVKWPAQAYWIYTWNRSPRLLDFTGLDLLVVVHTDQFPWVYSISLTLHVFDIFQTKSAFNWETHLINIICKSFVNSFCKVHTLKILSKALHHGLFSIAISFMAAQWIIYERECKLTIIALRDNLLEIL